MLADLNPVQKKSTRNPILTILEKQHKPDHNLPQNLGKEQE